MDPVNSNSNNGCLSISYPLDLVNQAREVILGAHKEFFIANSVFISEPPTEFSQLSFQLTSRLDKFSTLLSSTEFFSNQASNQGRTGSTQPEESVFAQTLETASFGAADTDEGSEGALDLEAQAQSVKNVIDEYNELLEWLDSSQYSISQSLKADLFKDIDSDVLEGGLSGAFAGLRNAASTNVDKSVSQTRQIDHFSPKTAGTSDSSIESELSEIGLTLNTDGTLDVEEDFEEHFKANFRKAYEYLAGEDGFFTKIISALDTLSNRDNRFNVYTHNDTTRVYTSDADVRVRNVYRENVASL